MNRQVEQIRAEVERQISEYREQHKTLGGAYYCGKFAALEDLLPFIDSLQEEPVSEDSEKENKIEILADIIFNAAKHGYMPYDTQDEYCAMEIAKKNIDKFIVSKKQEEPVSEDEIEKQFKAGDVVMYVSRHPAYSGLYLLGNPNDLSIGYSNANEPYQIALRNCTVASKDERKQFMRELESNGYKWNEGTLMIEKEEPVSEDLEKISYYFACMCNPLETAYSTTSPNPDVIKAFKAGAKWQKNQMMKDATDVTVHADAGGYPYIPQMELYDYDKDIPLAKEGDKYNVVLIKKD